VAAQAWSISVGFYLVAGLQHHLAEVARRSQPSYSFRRCEVRPWFSVIRQEQYLRSCACSHLPIYHGARLRCRESQAALGCHAACLDCWLLLWYLHRSPGLRQRREPTCAWLFVLFVRLHSVSTRAIAFLTHTDDSKELSFFKPM